MIRHGNSLRWAAAMVACWAALAGAEEPAGSGTQEPATSAQVIEGMVLDFNGSGIAGVEIRVEALDAKAEDPPLAQAVTNELGEIAIRLTTPVSESVRVRMRKEGYAEVVREVDPTDVNNPPFIDVNLEGTNVLSGTVRDFHADKPIAGAAVTCDNGGRSLSAQTDEAGQYEFKGIVQGPARLTFRADGYGTERETVSVGNFQLKLERKLQPARPVELSVRDSLGKPAGEVVIEAMVLPARDFIQAVTDAEGNARLQGIHPTAKQIRLRLNGKDCVRSNEFATVITLPELSEALASRPAPVRQRLTVRCAARAKGRVVEADSGQPVVGVRVVVGREPRSDMPVTWTDEDGRYELVGLEPGFNLISFQHLDYAPAMREVRMPMGSAATADVTLDRGQPVKGRVLDPDGQPLDQVWVTAKEWKGFSTLGMRTITDEDGAFAFTSAPQGEVTFTFVKPGFGPMVEKKFETGGTDYKVELAPAEPAAAPSMAEGSKIKTGQMVPDFTLTTVDGTTYKLSELKGKYVFLDCWASWCGPCRAEIPNVKALREATRERADFLLIGVSLDGDRKAFKTIVEEQEMDWPQAFGPKSGAREVFEMLNGVGIPYTCLIGPDGTLIAQDLRGSGMVEAVRKELSKGEKEPSNESQPGK